MWGAADIVVLKTRIRVKNAFTLSNENAERHQNKEKKVYLWDWQRVRREWEWKRVHYSLQICSKRKRD